MLTLLPVSLQDRRELAAFAGAACAAAGAAWTLDVVGVGAFFQPYLGELDPTLALVVAGLVGALSLRALQLLGWFDARRNSGSGIGATVVWASLLAGAATAVDALVGIDVVNAPAPWSFLFYPSIAFVVEVFFHLVPLVLLFACSRWAADINIDRAAPIGVLLISILEPAYQLKSALADQAISVLEVYVWAQVWAVNLAQLHLFRRYGFASMYGMRLVYYFWWHIVWGALR